MRIRGELVGRITSGGYGYTVGKSIGYAYLPPAIADEGGALQVDIFGEWVDARVATDILYDPAGRKIRS